MALSAPDNRNSAGEHVVENASPAVSRSSVNENSSAGTAPGFDSPTSSPRGTDINSRNSTPGTNRPLLTPDEVQEALEEKRDRRKLRKLLFKVFVWVAGIQLFLFPGAIIFSINSEFYISIISEANSRAMIASSIMVAMAGAIPLTIFVTLARMLHTPPTSEKYSDKEAQLTTAITSLLSNFSDVIVKIRDIWKS